MPSKKHKSIIFCDFDGTITIEETFAGMLKHFAADRYREIESCLIDRKLSLRDGIRCLLESIPSERYPEIVEYIRDKEIRPGFLELLDFLHAVNVPFVIISGGLSGSILSRLNDISDRIHAVHAADVSTEGPHLKVVSDFEGGAELVAKAQVMSHYCYDESIFIGDGISDINIALHASIVFARDSLCRYLDAKGKSYRRWNDFFDVKDFLAEHWECLNENAACDPEY
jgi:2-hydroxy-3-keto-5-methylthiopentenyl-1-phosphate phosphatase